MKFEYQRSITTKSEEIHEAPDGIHYVHYKDETESERVAKVEIVGQISKITTVYIDTFSQTIKDAYVRYQEDHYEQLPYWVEKVFAKEKNTKFITKDEFDKLYLMIHPLTYNEILDEVAWDQLNMDLKEFCDYHGYTNKPLQTVMPMVMAQIEKRVTINK